MGLLIKACSVWFWTKINAPTYRMCICLVIFAGCIDYEHLERMENIDSLFDPSQVF